MSIRTFRIAISTLLALATGLWAADTPPQPLHLVGDHWTAWQPPTSFPEGSKVYIVVPGDTFWELAQKELGNPHLWPQLWEKNQYVLDAHWIYPGDPLAMGIAVQPAETVGAVAGEGEEATGGEELAETGGEEATSAPMPGVDSAAAAAKAPQPLGAEDDIYCSGYVGELEEPFPFTITGSEYQTQLPALSGTSVATQTQGEFGALHTVKVGLTVGDIVYLDGGRAGGLSPGSLFSVVAAGPEVRHPLSQATVGRLYDYLGRVRVLSVQETSAIAEIVHACDAILVGARMRAFEPEPVPLARRGPRRPINDPPAAEALASAPVILRSSDGLVTFGEDHVVYIEGGAENDVTPGDMYTIYRMNYGAMPPVLVGELAVLSVHRTSAVARIIDSRLPVYAGDRLDRK